MSRFGYWAISNSASGGCGSHFSKWTTAVTVMMHICLTGDECRLTVKYYLLIKVQEWSKNVKKIKIACFEVNILRSRSPKGQKLPKTVTI